jgi:hypothetical protein
MCGLSIYIICLWFHLTERKNMIESFCFEATLPFEAEDWSFGRIT